MTVWFTADTHFDHANIMKFCAETRLGKTVDEMNDNIVTNWNRKVRPNDTVYHLGDFAWKPNKAEDHFNRLNGTIHLIVGNHDVNKIKKLGWASVNDYVEYKHHGRLIVLMHYPILAWKNHEHGSIHLYGHVHGNTVEPLKNTNSMDVGIDALECGRILIDLESVLCNFKGMVECEECLGLGTVAGAAVLGHRMSFPENCTYCAGTGKVNMDKS